MAIGFFALWSLRSNMVCALLILLFRPFRLGDESELPDTNSATGISGVVLDMNLLFVTLQEVQTDGRAAVMQIPRNQFFQRTIHRFDNSNAGDSFFG